MANGLISVKKMDYLSQGVALITPVQAAVKGNRKAAYVKCYIIHLMYSVYLCAVFILYNY
jgi:hypothetical protein